MSNEEMQKRIEFIIEQQAQLVVNQDKADERLKRKPKPKWPNWLKPRCVPMSD